MGLRVVFEDAVENNAEVCCSDDVHDDADCEKRRLLGGQTQFGPAERIHSVRHTTCPNGELRT